MIVPLVAVPLFVAVLWVCRRYGSPEGMRASWERMGPDQCWECPIHDGQLVCDPQVSLRCPKNGAS